MNGEGISLALTDAPTEEEKAFISQEIKAFNDRVSPYHRAARTTGVNSLAVLVRDGDDKLVGGLLGATYWGWLNIDDLWLHEEWRQKGIGRQKLMMAEEEARNRGCRRALLKTYSFQARGFYERCGYRVVGQLEDYPPGETFYWMRKDF